MVTWWLRGGYMVVTWWLHGGYTQWPVLFILPTASTQPRTWSARTFVVSHKSNIIVQRRFKRMSDRADRESRSKEVAKRADDERPTAGTMAPAEPEKEMQPELPKARATTTELPAAS